MDTLDFFAGNYSSFLADHALKRRLPISGTFELLPFCNLRCKMCYIVHEKNEYLKSQIKSIAFWDDVIDQAIEQGMLYAVVTGGEPFLYHDICRLLEHINRKPIHLALNTNGTLLNREKVSWLKKTYPGRLNISLYGGSNETYERLCGNPRGFDQVVQSFSLLNEYDIPFRVHTTLTPYNYGDFQQIVDICNQYRAPLQMVSYMFPPYRKDQGFIPNEGRFTPEQAAEAAYRVLCERYKDLRQRKMALEATCACFEEPEKYSFHGMRGITCRGGLSSFWIDWKGNVSGCGIHTVEQINLEKTSFAESWKIIVESSEKMVLSDKCSYCKYHCICPVCAASAFCETESVDGTPKYLCRFSEVYAELLLNELKKLREIDV